MVALVLHFPLAALLLLRAAGLRVPDSPHSAQAPGGGQPSLLQNGTQLNRLEEGTVGRRPETHLLAFRSCSQDPLKPCNKHFFEQLRSLSEAAAGIPSITRHHLYQGLPREIESDHRWHRHVEEGLRGRGFWFWKPALFNLLLRKGTLQDGDTIVWVDADMSGFWTKLYEGFLAHDRWDIFVESQPHCEMQWTKGDIFKHFGVPWSDPHYGLTPQAKAQFWVVRLNPRTRRFMGHWEDLMTDFHMVSDERSNSTSSPYFMQNRHDQSMLSMLLKANLAHMGPDPGHCKPFLANASRAGAPRRHETYGVPGLRAAIGDFGNEADLELKARAAAPTGPRAPELPPLRQVCVRGRCYDLDGLPPGRAPPGVAAA